MTFEKLSAKQRRIFRWCYKDTHSSIICDGAVRSGKTICMATSFILWAMRRFDGETFAICGKTVRSAERNIIMPLQQVADLSAYFRLSYTRSISLLTVEGGGRKNSFYIFGGRDESSYTLIQGITLSGVFFDEVALMPESFVDQAIARTLSVPTAKLWFNCNPENPHHWFYKEWVLGADKKNALHLHFLMNDNPVLTPEAIQKAENMYTGVFRKRYIDGLWASAEGVIYKEFADNSEPYLLDAAPSDIVFCTLGMDFGGNGSAHAIICTGFSKSLQRVIVLDEYYRREVITPTQLEHDACDFIHKCKGKYSVYDMYCDSAEQVLIKGLKTAVTREQIPINIHNARKTEILGRIRFFNSMMSQKRFFVLRHCKRVIEALQSAVWDSRKFNDVRLDDGNYNVDSLDALEYSTEPYMKDMIKLGVIQ